MAVCMKDSKCYAEELAVISMHDSGVETLTSYRCRLESSLLTPILFRLPSKTVRPTKVVNLPQRSGSDTAWLNELPSRPLDATWPLSPEGRTVYLSICDITGRRFNYRTASPRTSSPSSCSSNNSDFTTALRRIKDRLEQALQEARTSSNARSQGTSA